MELDLYQKFDVDGIIWSAHSRIEHFLEHLFNTRWYIINPFLFRARYLPPTYPIQMEDQYRLIPEDYVYGLKNLSNERYCQSMLFLILSLSM